MLVAAPAYLERLMQPHLPAGENQLVFATTADGLRLPVIDVTHPAFAIPDDPESLAARRDAFIAWDRRNRRTPAIVTRLLMRLAARRSLLLRKIIASDNNGYLDSITTYILKLGADHLPPGFDGPVDRRVAGAPHMALVRLRMQQIARLLADALLAPLADAPEAPLDLVNIAGGPALDSINTLIMLARARAGLIRRPIAIHVFDAQQDGPTFGARAPLRSLRPADRSTGSRSNSSTTLTTGTTPRRSRACSPASPRATPSSRPRRRAGCSSTAPMTPSSPTSPHSHGPASRSSPARSRARARCASE
jgi:hypothetical protein